MKRWKKILAAVTAGVLCVGSVGVTGLQDILESIGTVWSVSANYNADYNLFYTEYDDSIEINRCDSDITTIEIPSEINGKKITSIEADAFKNCNRLKKVYISSIADWCEIDFANDFSSPLRGADLYVNGKIVTDIFIPDGVTSIKKYAFQMCESIKSITIPDSVEYIGNCAFQICRNLTSVTVGSGLKSIEDLAFNSCTSLTDFVISDNVTSIGNNAFSGCTSMRSITIPSSVNEIGKEAFASCHSLQEVHISDLAAWCNIDFAGFGEYAYEDEYVRSSNPLVYGANIYINNEKVTEITIPDGVTEIKQGAFSGFTNLTSVVLSDGVESIGGFAFCHCDELTNITIPPTLTKIEKGAFWGCNDVRNVYISNVASWCNVEFNDSPLKPSTILYENGKKLTNVILPDTTVSIGNHAFYFNTSLTNIVIPKSVTSVKYGSFTGCTNLDNVTVENWQAYFDVGVGFEETTNVKFIIPDDFIQEQNDAIARYATQLDVKYKNGEILASACKGIKQLKEVTLENGITQIGGEAFSNCTNLKKIIIPRSVTSIRYTAFNEDDNLTIYGYEGSYAQTYAETVDIPFIVLDESEELITTTTTTTETTTTTITTTTTPTGSEGSPIYGDINLDGRIDITDAVLLNKYCAGSIEMNADALQNADCDGDKEIGNNDAIVLLKFLVQLVPTLPYSE